MLSNLLPKSGILLFIFVVYLLHVRIFEYYFYVVFDPNLMMSCSLHLVKALANTPLHHFPD